MLEVMLTLVLIKKEIDHVILMQAVDDNLLELTTKELEAYYKSGISPKIKINRFRGVGLYPAWGYEVLRTDQGKVEIYIINDLIEGVPDLIEGSTKVKDVKIIAQELGLERTRDKVDHEYLIHEGMNLFELAKKVMFDHLEDPNVKGPKVAQSIKLMASIDTKYLSKKAEEWGSHQFNKRIAEIGD